MVWSIILQWILHPIQSWKEKKKIKAKLKELRKRDPFIYK
jgi:hypothetical protein